MTLRSSYRDFWAGVGDRFPDLGGAASTHYYAQNERRLFTDYFGPLADLSILKTDLWDEAKNTRILAWASEHGARAYGVGISEPTVLPARAAFRDEPPHSAVSHLRGLPVRDGSFTELPMAPSNISTRPSTPSRRWRVLKPGGRAIMAS